MPGTPASAIAALPMIHHASRNVRASSGKAILSTRDAQQITEAYRKHLDSRRRPD